MRSLLSLALYINFLGLAFSQYFPPTPQNVTVVKSKQRKGVSISYKEPGLCETTPGVKSYTGYVHLPPGTLADVQQDQFYPIHQFFWFVESRKDPENAPLVIWFNGGPGTSSLVGVFGGNGPCTVSIDSNSTSLNPWSWNNEANILYIDQPNQVGFSYDEIASGTLNFDSREMLLVEPTDALPQQNDTFLVGKFPSQDPAATANTTTNAARALWVFSQVWLQEFPGYKSKNDKISIFTESYGGRLGPSVGAFFEEQNERIRNDSITNESSDNIINLDTLGIMNGCIDLVSQELSYPEFAHNNTYGIEAINETLYEEAISNYHRPKTGCLALILKCQSLADKFDPDAYGIDEEVNAACAEASDYCVAQVEAKYYLSNSSPYDIAALWRVPFIPPYYLGFLSQPWVQAALGVPVNFTAQAESPDQAFNWTGDYARKDRRSGQLGDMAYLLDKGVKIALLYGDRDFSCNWIGGENVSLAVNYSQAAAFRSAGYEDITVNDSYIGGQVRQHGNYSFSRVYQASGAIAVNQPETAYQIFRRAIFGLDIAAGTVSTENQTTPTYSSKGTPTTSQQQQTAPDPPVPTCYTLDPEHCSDKAWGEIYFSTGVIHNYILLDENTAHLFSAWGLGNATTTNQTKGEIGKDKDDGGRATRPNPGSSITSALPNNSSRAGRVPGAAAVAALQGMLLALVVGGVGVSVL